MAPIIRLLAVRIRPKVVGTSSESSTTRMRMSAWYSIGAYLRFFIDLFRILRFMGCTAVGIEDVCGTGSEDGITSDESSTLRIIGRIELDIREIHSHRSFF